MNRLILIVSVLTLLFYFSDIYAQSDEPELKIFGYFQSEFQDISGWEQVIPDQNSFLVQQLNLFLQRDISRYWTSFVNFELLSSYSSQRNWGEFSLEEAWVRHTKDEKLNVKIGLLIPTFNNLNEIKNRTPLLPYIIRPLAYETSMKAYVPVSEYIPQRANIQIYGFFRIGGAKLDYAAFTGNSPNIASSGEYHLGADTTRTMLFGGRVGIRYENLKCGFSISKDDIKNFALLTFTENDLDRERIGFDLSYSYDRFSFESEFINVNYDEGTPGLKINREFYYGTLAMDITEQLTGYVSYWNSCDEIRSYALGKMEIPNFGMAYHVNDRIVFKWQYAHVVTDQSEKNFVPGIETKFGETADYINLAVSVYF